MRMVVLAILFVLVAATSYAEVYFTSNDGDDDNAGTEAAPFRTIQKGLDVVRPGDTLRVMAGTYPEALVLGVTGTESAPITVTNYNGEVTINSGNAKAIRSNGSKHYYTFDHLNIVSEYVNYATNFDYSLDFEDGAWSGDTSPDSGNNGFVISNCNITGAAHFYGHYNTVRNSTLNGKGQWRNGIREYFAASHDNVYRGNTIHDYQQRGIWSMSRVRNVLIENNTVYNSDAPIDLDGAGSPVYNGKVRKNVVYGYKADGIILENAFASVVEDNIIYGWLGSGVGDGIQLINYGKPISYDEFRGTDTNTIVRNNIIRDSGRAGIELIASPGNKVLNNTIYNTKAPGRYYGSISLTGDGSGYYSNNATIINNLVHGWNTYGLWFSSSVAGLTARNNIYFDPVKTLTHYDQKLAKAYSLQDIQSLGLEAESLLADPQFIDAAGGNFDVAPSSPALRAGLNLAPDVTDDIIGTARPATSRYTVGAYEHPVKLSPPENLTVEQSDSGTLSLSWTAPATYTDGRPATEVTGFKLYIGNASGSYYRSTDLGNRVSYPLSGLDGGRTYYLAVTAYDADLLESAYSNEVSSTLPLTHVIRATYQGGGTVAAIDNRNVTIATDGTTTTVTATVNDGADQLFDIMPASGNEIADVAVDGTSVGPLPSYTFRTITADHVLRVTFKKATFTISASAGTGGTITPPDSATYDYGADQTYSITANTGYLVADVKVDGTSIGAVSTYTFSNITANHTIAATFTPITFTITASAGTGGTITPSSGASFDYGASQTYAIVASTGYVVADVKVDGSSVGALSTYTFSNITANHTIAAAFSPGFTITATAEEGGSLTPSGTITVAEGGSQTFAIAAAVGFAVLDVRVDGTSLGKVTSYTFSNVTAPHTISATFERVATTWTIAASAGAGGSIAPSGTITVVEGSTQTFSITAAPGYAIGGIEVDGASLGPLTSYTFNNVTSNHAISAIFTPVTYTITASAGTGGSITPTGVVSVNHGASQIFAIAPATGYLIAEVKVDGASVGQVSSYTFSDVTTNHTIAASFTPLTYTITASATLGGTITPAGAVSVNHGASQTFAIAPATGYLVAEVKVDGTSVGQVSSYTFSDVTTNHTIAASFTLLTYTITASAGSGGTITPAGAVAVNHGASQTFAIAPLTGYLIAEVKVDGASVGQVSSYTFSDVTTNHTIAASFTPVTYTITASAGTGGSITPTGPASYNYGSTATFTIAPAIGYVISDVTVDGKSVGALATYTFSSITASHTIAATFSRQTFTISSSAGSGGTISPTGATTVNYGASQTYSIVPAKGYFVSNVTVDGSSLGAVATYTFNNVTANHTIAATFTTTQTFIIVASAEAGGTITPSGTITVRSGGSQTFTIRAGTGYAVSDVKVDGVSVGAVTSYTFSKVTASHTISATFKTAPVTFTITASAGTGGTISPSGTTSYPYGASQSFTIAASTGYVISDVKVDNVSVGAVSSYAFNNITANHTIRSTFSRISKPR